MYKKIILFLAIIIFAISAYSQEVENATTIDKDTYILWLAKDWDRLITIGKTAIKNEVDFYYLRVRMGIAYFEKKNYHKAIYHFEKAYKFNPNEYF
ncbi:MAG: tetratricopeptide repeat protein, partial [Salinivirgaceae bacterium]|nr:tetratricopeptide repeat protein [Salinivirgaceae bacterium]